MKRVVSNEPSTTLTASMPLSEIAGSTEYLHKLLRLMQVTQQSHCIPFPTHKKTLTQCTLTFECPAIATIGCPPVHSTLVNKHQLIGLVQLSNVVHICHTFLFGAFLGYLCNLQTPSGKTGQISVINCIHLFHCKPTPFEGPPHSG